MNLGQLAMILRARFLLDVESYRRCRASRLFAAEIEHAIAEEI